MIEGVLKKYCTGTDLILEERVSKRDAAAKLCLTICQLLPAHTARLIKADQSVSSLAKSQNPNSLKAP
jgi:hypothetical protein